MSLDSCHSNKIIIIMATDLFMLVEQGDLEKLTQALTEEESSGLLCHRNEFCRSALDIAVILGKDDMIELLLGNGASVNSSNKTGYTALHIGSMWGYKSSLKLLVAAGAECKLATNKSETAKDIASRYGHEDCVQFLECTEAKSILKKAINAAKDTLLDSERITGKWNKEDKSKVTALCNEKMDWVDRDIDYTKEEISSQLTDFEERYQPHLTKLDPL